MNFRVCVYQPMHFSKIRRDYFLGKIKNDSIIKNQNRKDTYIA